MPPPVPRWTRWVRSLVGRPIPAGPLVASDVGLPQDTDGSASTTNLSGPHRMFTRVTACLLAGPPKAVLCVGGFDGFVTSTAAPTATGWRDPVAGWELHPLKTYTFARRTASPFARPCLLARARP